MKRPGYRVAVRWIAENDEPEDTDASTVSSLITVLLVADLFEVEPERVAKDVVRIRQAAELPLALPLGADLLEKP